MAREDWKPRSAGSRNYSLPPGSLSPFIRAQLGVNMFSSSYLVYPLAYWILTVFPKGMVYSSYKS